MPPSYHPVTEKITNLLKQNNFWFETFEHESVRTSEEAAKIRPGYNLKQGAKALILKIKRYRHSYLMVVLPGDLKFDSKKLKALTGISESTFASESEVGTITNGVLVGGVPPFGNLFGLDVYADLKLFDNEKIAFNAGDRCFSVGMKSADYRSLVKPQVGNLAVG